MDLWTVEPVLPLRGRVHKPIDNLMENASVYHKLPPTASTGFYTLKTYRPQAPQRPSNNNFFFVVLFKGSLCSPSKTKSPIGSACFYIPLRGFMVLLSLIIARTQKGYSSSFLFDLAKGLCPLDPRPLSAVKIEERTPL